MDGFRRCSGVCVGSLLVVILLRMMAASATQADGVVMFLEGNTLPSYLRGPSYSDIEKEVFSYQDVAAALEVLLGVCPELAVDETVASKLDSVVARDPFTRPRAVISVNIGGVELDMTSGSEAVETFGFRSYQQRPLMASDSHTSQISGDDVKVEILTSLDAAETHPYLTYRDLEDLLEGTSQKYDDDTGGLTAMSWNLNNGETFILNMSESADRVFLYGLMAFLRNMRRALSPGHRVNRDPEERANLYFGTFNGIQEMRKFYGSGQKTQLASKFVLHELNQALQRLQIGDGNLVGVFTFRKGTSRFEITSTERRARSLQSAAPAAGNETYPEQQALQLANHAVVFFTVLILILALLLSTCCMFTMPVTKDSLLYSGVKLD